MNPGVSVVTIDPFPGETSTGAPAADGVRRLHAGDQGDVPAALVALTRHQYVVELPSVGAANEAPVTV